MSNGDIFSIFINLLVGLYFAVLYPRTLKRRFSTSPIPPGFVLLQRYVPLAGWLIVSLTLIYTLSQLI